jgi:hypothetical protein
MVSNFHPESIGIQQMKKVCPCKGPIFTGPCVYNSTYSYFNSSSSKVHLNIDVEIQLNIDVEIHGYLRPEIL